MQGLAIRPIALATSFVVSIAAAGCGSSSGGGARGGSGGDAGGGGASAGTGGSASAGTGGSGGGATGGGAGGSGGGAPATYAVHFGPVQLAAGAEKTQCVVVRLGNPAPIHVGKIRNQLGEGSLQMILYTVTDTTEQTTPFDCAPFSSLYTQTGMTPLTVTQSSDETLAFPAGVGIPLAANQMMRIELHAMNANASDPIALQAMSTLTTMPDSAFQNAASFLILQDIDISIAAQATFTLGPVFVALPSKYATASFFAFTSEQRRWGVSAQLWSAASATDAGTSIYMNTSGNQPPLATLQPPLAGATTPGLKLQCAWMNNSQMTVKNGQGFVDETCFFVAYYYPSQGPSICVHTDQVSGGATICCPGDASCASLGN